MPTPHFKLWQDLLIAQLDVEMATFRVKNTYRLLSAKPDPATLATVASLGSRRCPGAVRMRDVSVQE